MSTAVEGTLNQIEISLLVAYFPGNAFCCGVT